MPPDRAKHLITARKGFTNPLAGKAAPTGES
jgi:hypothetical protein